MKRSGIVLIVSFLLVIVFGSARVGGNASVAQTSGNATAQQALEDVLLEYVSFTRQGVRWQLGEIQQAGAYAISIAESEYSGSSEQGYVLLIARRRADGFWYAVAPELVDAVIYDQWLKATPESLLDEYDKAFFYRYTPEDFSYLEPRSATLHHFPWPIAQTARVTQKEGTYHENQIDFVIQETDTVYASKPGVVIFKKEVSDTGGCDIDLWRYANLVVIQHTATEYSWYFHLAQNSVTVEVGDLIGYGTKIGEQGNTGFACGTTGIHLHYMVSTAIPAVFPDPNVVNAAPWPPGGTIVTVDFIEATWDSLVVYALYESQNKPSQSSCSDTPSIPAVFENTYCNGKISEWTEAGMQILDAPGLADNIESIEVPAGWSAALYRDENEYGPALCLNQTDHMLWDNNFTGGDVVANRTSWLRLYETPGCPYPDVDGIKFLPDLNFIGIPVWGMVGARATNGPEHTAGSIYLPDGYAATIYDQDNLSGNSLCFTGSILDLASLGWADRAIESVDLELGGSCEPISGDVPQPVPINPLPDADVYGPIAPELCWLVEGDYEGLVYKVMLVRNTTIYESDWTLDTCWAPEEIAGSYGDYSWKVRAKNTDEQLGEWSPLNNFTYLEDTVNPSAAIMFPVDNGRVVRPRANIIADAQDNESGVARVYFFAWFDNGSGIYDWHYLGEDTTGEDGWRFTWNLTDIASNDAAVYISVQDFADNSMSVLHSGIAIADTMGNGEGFEYREGEGTAPEGIPTLPEPGNAPENPLPNEEFNTGGGPGDGAPENSAGVDSPVRPGTAFLPAVKSGIHPQPGAVFYAPGLPELCWEPIQSAEEVEYRVEINAGERFLSPWQTATCWAPELLNGEFDTFDWRVRARTPSGLKSAWSERGSFSYLLDESPPEVTMVAPRLGETFEDQMLIEVQTSDAESGVQRVYFLAYYDDGSGYQWHTLEKMQVDAGGAIRFLWDVSEIEPQDVQIWVYVKDAAENLGFGTVERLHLVEGTTVQETAYPKSMVEVEGR
jgi:murein DD-endopeptidase MepM/ murein hydrolase activator NlpD